MTEFLLLLLSLFVPVLVLTMLGFWILYASGLLKSYGLAPERSDYELAAAELNVTPPDKLMLFFPFSPPAREETQQRFIFRHYVLSDPQLLRVYHDRTFLGKRLVMRPSDVSSGQRIHRVNQIQPIVAEVA